MVRWPDSGDSPGGNRRASRMRCDPPVDPDAYPFSHRVRVRFVETDAMGVVHHSAYVPYMEEARVEYLRSIGHPYSAVRAEGLEFAVIEVLVRYLRPLLFDDLVDIHVAVAVVNRATFEIAYLLFVDGELRATAVSVHAAVNRAGRPVRSPDWLPRSLPPDARGGDGTLQRL